jgi:hypothetical protein
VFSTAAVVAGYKWSLILFPGGKGVQGQVSAYLRCGGPADVTDAPPVVIKYGDGNVVKPRVGQQGPAELTGNSRQGIITAISSTGIPAQARMSR